MVLNLKKPLAFFDLETTGMNIAQDRIVEISVVKMEVNGTRQIYTRRLNPTIPISLESSMVHGIYYKDVQNEPTFKLIANELFDLLKGCDLAGYNLIKFDVPILVEEFLRVGLDFSLTNRHIVDAQKIFYLMEPRTLTAAYKYFCNKELEGAHSAEHDTIATLEVLEAQIERYKGVKIKDKDGNLIEPVVNDVEALHKLTVSQFADLAGRISFNHEGVEVFNFGKHKNVPVLEVLKKEPAYYDWMMKGDFPLQTKKVLTEIRLRGFNTK